jgi:hypothetical protein
MSLSLACGSGAASLMDLIAYPHGACCCERAHGRAHRCHCPQPHDSDEAEAVHAEAGCASVQWSDDGDEYGPPDLISLPPLAAAAVPRLSDPHEALARSVWSTPLLLSCDPGAPPTPPPKTETA